MRAGDAKLCGRVRGECLSTLEVSILTFPAPPATPAMLCSFAFFMIIGAHGTGGGPMAQERNTGTTAAQNIEPIDSNHPSCQNPRKRHRIVNIVRSWKPLNLVGDWTVNPSPPPLQGQEHQQWLFSGAATWSEAHQRAKQTLL